MTRQVQALVMLLMGSVALRLVWTGSYLNYVRPAMFWLLLAAGGTLVILAVLRWWLATGLEPADHTTHHHPGPRSAWLLVLPVLVIFIVRASPLGSFAAERQTSYRPEQEQVTSGSRFPPLPPPTNGAVDVRLIDFVERAYLDGSNAIAGARVRLIGFVAEAPRGERAVFFLTRFRLSCCAADGVPIRVAVHGIGAAEVPPRDSWVEVTGTWRPWTLDPTSDIVALDGDGLRGISRPRNPYA